VIRRVRCVRGTEAVATSVAPHTRSATLASQDEASAERSSCGAFTLIETLVAVTVLSVGIVLVLQAMTHGMTALDAARESLRTAWLCRDRLASLHVEAQRMGGVAETSDQGRFARPFADYQWTLHVEPASDHATELHGAAASNVLLRVALDVGRMGATRSCAMGTYVLARRGR
jgi:prepilin-type N-terminal cleavage/methylation domain-containing protein